MIEKYWSARDETLLKNLRKIFCKISGKRYDVSNKTIIEEK